MQTGTVGLGPLSNYPRVDLSMSYDNNGNRLSLGSDEMSLAYSYDNMNRLVNLTNSSSDSFNFNYDLASRLTRISRPGGRTDFSYLERVR